MGINLIVKKVLNPSYASNPGSIENNIALTNCFTSSSWRASTSKTGTLKLCWAKYF
ncbi:hypothetical protein NEIELOOT_00335 [Neisseria elongata subsp. glycolytica ATCC 29315]|uniref:Uncharacterized protein n=1 Tax=Neisseria elongata subsp. glycolytica ATCC 29315 TaxID=546263 RepID=D4DMR0_NEIEG|nr:hypothetical protein NEIELOOT_00335 [Neisseria elongata subsp. glycolytica ATCC 29315]